MIHRIYRGSKCSHPSESHRWIRRSIATLLISLLFGVAGCAAPKMKDELIRTEPGFALAPADGGVVAEIARGVALEHGSEASGFQLLDASADGLKWRVALIDSAVSSVDIQTYLWYPDNSGRLIMERAIRAADRGVKVRMIVDDLLTIGHDQLIKELDERANIEFRIFNPWSDRDMLSRGGEMIAQMERLNTRMHDKLLIVDGRAAVVGGRNIGDHYFGLSPAYNFHDLDLIAFGHLAAQANDMFDQFWNSEWVVSAQNLDVVPNPEFVREAWQRMLRTNREAVELQPFLRDPPDWVADLSTLSDQLHIGTSHLAYDAATAGEISQNLGREMFAFLRQAQEELLITNAYIIPGDRAIELLQSLADRGVKVRILTNSLASHDVPAVNSHYKDWRDDIINTGADLYELRSDPAIKSIVDVPPVVAEFTGLHTKAVVIDRKRVFVGSMNFDPRSFNINTEMGAFVDSAELGEELARLMERDMEPDNAWQVLLDADGNPYWVNSDETVYEQPARRGSQRVMDVIFKMFPKDQY